MACERYREAVADVAAGLPAPAGLDAHLATCKACRAELAGLRHALAVADTELARLLSAEPTPELAARIRHAVAESDPSPGWRFGWVWPATATVATLLVALAVFLARGTPSAPESRMAVDARRPQSAGSTRAVEAAGADGLNDVVTPRSPGQAGRRGVRSPGGSLGTRQAGVPREDRAPEPEVLVPPGEGEALLRFAAQLQRRAVAPDSLLVADLSAPLAEPRAVEMAPLEIIPLDPDETSGTD
jgi:hypothetical protein